MIEIKHESASREGEGRTTYYKATRPDGRDFQTGTIDYAATLASGAVVRHPTSRRMVRDEPATYLSVSVEPADCTGFSWPCRLFRVEPEGDALDGMDLRNKRGVLALRVVEELPAGQALGPNGEAVAAFIERCRTLTLEQARKLAAAWAATWDAAGAAAWDVAESAARAAAWDAAGDAAWDVAGDVAGAILVRDRITPEQYAILVRPFVDAGLGEWVK